MPQTRFSTLGEKFLINEKLVYSENEGNDPKVHGLLMNARMIQGIFDDEMDPSRFERWGFGSWDPEAQTDRLIAALPQWYAKGLRAITVGLQGGGPCFTVDNATIKNNPFGEDGKEFDARYASRIDRLIQAADRIGMLVIVSYFYAQQSWHLKDGRAVRNAVGCASRFLRDGGYTNVIIEVANEMDLPLFDRHPIIHESQGMAALIDLAREESGGMMVGCSGTGGYVDREVAEASDIILIHGNAQTRQQYYNMFTKVRSWGLNRPIVCNEDSQKISQLDVSYKGGVSWGYYNNMTLQEPPTDWTIKRGEDQFFAWRMADGLGIAQDPIPADDQFYLQGLEADWEYNGERWIRLAALYPEKINYVEFYLNDVLVYTSYDEPFTVNFVDTWCQLGWKVKPTDKEWKAVIHLHNGEIVEKTVAL